MADSFAIAVNALGWALLHSVWQGAVIGLLFLLSRSVLSSASPSIRHANALGWLILLVMLPVGTFVALLLAGPGAVHTGHSASVLEALSVGIWAAHPHHIRPGVLQMLGGLWMAGVMVLTVRLIGEWHVLKRAAGAESRRLPQLDKTFAELKRAMGVDRATHLVEAAHALVPMVVGVLRPVIVIPGSVLLGLTPRELELIIAHELAHLRRRDHLINALLIVAETLLFYHPAVYALTRSIRHERELCCDDLVLGTFDERVCYAHALSKVEALRGADFVPSTSLQLAAADGPLVTRIARMVRARRHTRWGIMPAVLMPLVALTIAFSVFLQAHVASVPQAQTVPESISLRAESRADLTPPDEQDRRFLEEGDELWRITVPHYPRRAVDASAVSRITYALTSGDATQSLTAIERGVLVHRRPKTAGPKPSTPWAQTKKRPARVQAYPDGARAPVSDESTEPHATLNPAEAPASQFAPAGGIREGGGPASGAAASHDNPARRATASEAVGAPRLPSSDIERALPVDIEPVRGLMRSATAAADRTSSDAGWEKARHDTVIETGGELIYRVTPRYPVRARSRGLVDKVVVSIDVDETGKVDRVSVINRDSRPMFQRAVLRAVSQWEFKPLIRNGVAVGRTVEQSFDFRLEPFAAKRRSSSCRGARTENCRLSTWSASYDLHQSFS